MVKQLEKTDQVREEIAAPSAVGAQRIQEEAQPFEPPKQELIRQHRLSLTTVAQTPGEDEGASPLSEPAKAQLSKIATNFNQAVETQTGTEELTNSWKGFVQEQLRSGTADVDQLMLELKRQSCLEKQDNLDDYADRIRLNRELRKKAEQEMTRARDVLGSAGPDGALDVPFEPASIQIDPNTFAGEADQLIDINGDGTEFMMPPDMYHSHGVAEAVKVMEESAITEVQEVGEKEDVAQPEVEDPYAVARCRSSKCNPTNLNDEPALKLAIYTCLQQGNSTPEQLAKALDEQFGIKATATTITTEDGQSYKAIDLGNGKIYADGDGNGALNVGDYNFSGALQDIQTKYGVSADVFSQMAPKYVQEQLTKMEASFADTGKEFPRDQLARIFAMAFVMSADEMIMTKGQLQDYVKNLEATLKDLSESNDTTNQDLQQAMFEQQLTLHKAGDLYHALNEAADEVAGKEQEGQQRSAETGESADASGQILPDTGGRLSSTTFKQ